MNAQVSFLEGELSLIHIPLELYSSLLQPILQVLLPQRESLWPENRTTASDAATAAPPPEGVLTPDHGHGFLNVSVTPVECSVVCHTSWVAAVFEPAIKRLLPRDAARRVSVSRDRYVALCVINAGMDAGSRVVDLSSPLALAGIPIFFITTYYSDFILCPSKDRQSVVAALLASGFDFSSDDGSAFVSPVARTPGGGGGLQTHSRAGSGSGSGSSRSGSGSGAGYERPSGLVAGPETTPKPPVPPNAAELQARTFDLLRRRRVEPRVEPDLHLIHCSGHETSTRQLAGEISVGLMSRPSLSRLNTGPNGTNGGGGCFGGGGGDGSNGSGGGNGARHNQNGGGTHSGHDHHNGHDHNRQCGQPQHFHQAHTWADTVDTRLYACLVAALAGRPRFLSVTLAQDDPPSLLLDKRLLPLFGDSVMGYTEGDLVPIFLDLAALPFEATGIVSGVAGRLVREMVEEEEHKAAQQQQQQQQQQALNAPLLPELSYLSTARAGAVILPREQSEKALEILRPLLLKG